MKKGTGHIENMVKKENNLHYKILVGKYLRKGYLKEQRYTKENNSLKLSGSNRRSYFDNNIADLCR
jgi:hypothetical protein